MVPVSIVNHSDSHFITYMTILARHVIQHGKVVDTLKCCVKKLVCLHLGKSSMRLSQCFMPSSQLSGMFHLCMIARGLLPCDTFEDMSLHNNTDFFNLCLSTIGIPMRTPVVGQHH